MIKMGMGIVIPLNKKADEVFNCLKTANDPIANRTLDSISIMNGGKSKLFTERDLSKYDNPDQNEFTLAMYVPRGAKGSSQDWGRIFIDPRALQFSKKELSNIILHEARHARQDQMRGQTELEARKDFDGNGKVDERNIIAENDKDGDFLPDEIPVAFSGEEFEEIEGYEDPDPTTPDRTQNKSEEDALRFSNLFNVKNPQVCN